MEKYQHGSCMKEIWFDMNHNVIYCLSNTIVFEKKNVMSKIVDIFFSQKEISLVEFDFIQLTLTIKNFVLPKHLVWEESVLLKHVIIMCVKQWETEDSVQQGSVGRPTLSFRIIHRNLTCFFLFSENPHSPP